MTKKLQPSSKDSPSLAFSRQELDKKNKTKQKKKTDSLFIDTLIRGVTVVVFMPNYFFENIKVQHLDHILVALCRSNNVYQQ